MLTPLNHRRPKGFRVDWDVRKITFLEKAVTDAEKSTLWAGAFRYYCGRMTYAVSDFCKLLRKEWSTLPERTQSLIRTELEEAFARDDEFRVLGRDHYAPLGADCDRKEWEKVREIWNTSNAKDKPPACGSA